MTSVGKGQWDGEGAGVTASRVARLTGTEIYPGSGLQGGGAMREQLGGEAPCQAAGAWSTWLRGSDLSLASPLPR